jgi:cyclopropane fatty-acyl-phospholipid synthase-like methyltransferase
VTGIDLSARAIAAAERKADERGLTARLIAGDALGPLDLGAPFDVALDSGLFHVFSDEDRPRYVKMLRERIAPGGLYLLLCFSDRQPGEAGPRRVTEAEIRSSFTDGWTIESIVPAKFEIAMQNDEARATADRLGFGPAAEAWLATIVRS